MRQKQQLLNLSQHKLKGEVATRWEYTYEMVSCIVEQQQTAIFKTTLELELSMSFHVYLNLGDLVVGVHFAFTHFNRGTTAEVVTSFSPGRASVNWFKHINSCLQN